MQLFLIQNENVQLKKLINVDMKQKLNQIEIEKKAREVS